MSGFKALHKLFSPFLYKSGLYQKIWRARYNNRPFTIAVVYHRITSDQDAVSERFDIERGMPASVFEKQMQFMVRHFSPVKASQAQNFTSSNIQFAVTLDDGYEDNYHVATPILKRLGIPATFFVVSNFVGTDRLFWWEQIAHMMHASHRVELDLGSVVPTLLKPGSGRTRLPLGDDHERDIAYRKLCSLIREGLTVDVESHVKSASDYFEIDIREEGRQYDLMNWTQLKALVADGFEIGCHTASHSNVIGCSEATLISEVADSLRMLEGRLDCPVESFAYPYGVYGGASKRIKNLLMETNCKSAFTGDQGVVQSDSYAYELPRTKMNRSYDFACAYNVQDTLNAQVSNNGSRI